MTRGLINYDFEVMNKLGFFASLFTDSEQPSMFWVMQLEQVLFTICPKNNLKKWMLMELKVFQNKMVLYLRKMAKQIQHTMKNFEYFFNHINIAIKIQISHVCVYKNYKWKIKKDFYSIFF